MAAACLSPCSRSFSSLECTKLSSSAPQRFTIAATSTSYSGLSSFSYKSPLNFLPRGSTKGPYEIRVRRLVPIVAASLTDKERLASFTSAAAVELTETAAAGDDGAVVHGHDVLVVKNRQFLSADVLAEAQVGVEDGRNSCCVSLISDRDSMPNAVDRVAPAVVSLSVSQGFDGITTRKSMGSGTIIYRCGIIMTSAHVVADFQGKPKGKVDVTLQDGQIFEGTVLNANLHYDIAFVKINSKTPLPTAKLGSSSKLRLGDRVLAIGCPGFFPNTVTAGIISYIGRKSSELGLGGMQREYLQTDCAINKGNSGGPLVNIDGEVVGVIVMKANNFEGIGFSVPIDSFSKIIEHFKKSGRFDQPWLELTMLDFNETVIAQLKERNAAFPNVNKGNSRVSC